MSDQKKILIVDDVEANRFVLRNIISDMGYLPVLAENGIQTLKIMEHIKPNLILLDVAMPQMDGFELCGILKNDPLTREIPVIFISAFDSPDDITKGFSVGGEDYITKPFSLMVLRARVERMRKRWKVSAQRRGSAYIVGVMEREDRETNEESEPGGKREVPGVADR